MNSSSREPLPLEIWLANLRFADNPEIGKVRPVVIVDSGVLPLVVAKVTTAEPRDSYRYCVLNDWKSEGLLRPSRVQTFPLFRLSRGDLLNGQPLGTLSEKDSRAVRTALNGQ